MYKLDTAQEGTPTQKYHQHPLFTHLPLQEAIQKGLAIPAHIDYPSTELRRNCSKLRELRLAKSLYNVRKAYLDAESEGDNQQESTVGSSASLHN